MTRARTRPSSTLPLAGLALAIVTAAAGPASAQINTGGVGGAYHAQFCPALSRELKLAQLDYACAPSAGTRENIERVLANPRQIGYGQLDVYALETRNLKAEGALTVVRQDDVRECVFAVTRNKGLSTYGDLAANAGKLRFILRRPAVATAVLIDGYGFREERIWGLRRSHFRIEYLNNPQLLICVPRDLGHFP